MEVWALIGHQKRLRPIHTWTCWTDRKRFLVLFTNEHDSPRTHTHVGRRVLNSNNSRRRIALRQEETRSSPFLFAHSLEAIANNNCLWFMWKMFPFGWLTCTRTQCVRMRGHVERIHFSPSHHKFNCGYGFRLWFVSFNLSTTLRVVENGNNVFPLLRWMIAINCRCHSQQRKTKRITNQAHLSRASIKTGNKNYYTQIYGIFLVSGKIGFEKSQAQRKHETAATTTEIKNVLTNRLTNTMSFPTVEYKSEKQRPEWTFIKFGG